VKMAYIHQVQAQELTFGLPSEDEYKMSKIFFFTNYVQAALHAYKRQFLSAPGLCRVTLSAVDQFDSSGGSEEAKEDLTASVKEVLAYLDWSLTTKPRIPGEQPMTPEVALAVTEYSARIKLPGTQMLIVTIPKT